MKNGMLLKVAAVAGSLMVSSGLALAQDKPADCGKAAAPAMVEGQVTKVDMGQGRLTLRAADGSVHEFQASRETLAEYKVGDPVKAKLRMAPRCD
ncbi:hypothetical protein [Thiobacillus sp. 65-1402]|uniref:hypothetical protein n=1 Tax=Thiobacillus sp. 65-1402 TaxID=1895861 RepID=UPI000AD7B5D1|nr:hypothetical protein [Thiobacillus sp. 65-1402]